MHGPDPTGNGRNPLALLVPDVMLPLQFAARRGVGGRVAGSPRLALAVLQLAVSDMMNLAEANDGPTRKIYREARRWVCSEDLSWPYAFARVCEALDLPAHRLRCQLLTADEVERARVSGALGKLFEIMHG